MADTSYHFQTNAEIIAGLGRKVRRARLQRNIPQEVLAQQAGVALGAVKQLEAGRDVRLSSLIAILRALDELSGIAGWLPPEEPSPLELMDVGHVRSKARRFARRAKLE
jgi:transcriptional regulator with XRE-family HTH domain